jgi:hypothetical protein
MEPFADLPSGLVEVVLEQTSRVGADLLSNLRRIDSDRDRLRADLDRRGLLLHDSSLGEPRTPTTCATDGSYAMERLLTYDLVASAAVAVEGLTPPSENGRWEQPRHSTFVAAEVHHTETAAILQADMVGKELLLARDAPHELVMIDGSLKSPRISFNKAVRYVHQAPNLRVSREFAARFYDYLAAYREILQPVRAEQNCVGLPKYSIRGEIGDRLGWPPEQNDRGLLTLLLRAGELTRPLCLEPQGLEWNLNTAKLTPETRDRLLGLLRDIVGSLKRIHVFYYRPSDWIPALRVEVPEPVAANEKRLALVVFGIKHQCASPSMLEPFPLYLADRTVRALARSIPAFRHATTQSIAERYEGNIDEVFLAMHGYRSETGA